MINDLISVIIPMYNAEEFIMRCINSILNQTYGYFELIIIDDGSTDNSYNIVKEIKDKRIKLIKKKNSGVSSSRNMGLDLAIGKYITFVDADDMLNKNFFEDSVSLLKKYSLDFIIGGTIKKYSNYEQAHCLKNFTLKIYENENIIKLQEKIIGYSSKLLPEINDCFMSGSVCKMFNSDLLKGIYFKTNLNTGEDIIFNLEILEKSKKIGIVNNIWYYYYIYTNSSTRKYNKDGNVNAISFLTELYKFKNKTNLSACNMRAFSQLEYVVMSYPMHPKSKFDFKEKNKMIKQIANDKFWKKLINNTSIKDIYGFRYKLILILYKLKFYNCICLIYSLISIKRNKEVNELN